MTNRSWEVHKFGGSSLACAERFIRVSELLNGADEFVVVSATEGTTSSLQSLLDEAVLGRFNHELLQNLEQKHIGFAHELVDESQRAQVITHIKQDVQAIADLLNTVLMLKVYSPELQARVIGCGEKWSAQILSGYLLRQGQKSYYLDASEVLVLSNGAIDWQKSVAKLAPVWQHINQASYAQVVATGFIASDESGVQMTLGRNGSDYSAAIFAKLIQASKLTIWTDVDGIMSADPRKVPTAFPLEKISYHEALELAYFGATVLHPSTIEPAMDAGVTISIKNSFKPKAAGTEICQIAADDVANTLIKGVTSVEGVALLNVEGSGMAGVPGSAERIFQVLRQADISAILISQASSEQSICVAVAYHHSERAVKLLQENFQYEIEYGRVKSISADADCSVIAAVGDGMVGQRGVAAKICQALAMANVNIKAIAQGVAERNISLVVARDDIERAMRAIHSGLYLSNKTISVGLIGPGRIGSTLLAQLNQQNQVLKQEFGLNLRLRGIANSSQMLLSDLSKQDEIGLEGWQDEFGVAAQPLVMDDFMNHVVSDAIPHSLIIDCTASDATAKLYPEILNRGAHIVTPNKKANSSALEFYDKLFDTAKKTGHFYLYETTVCAGLPVIKTIQDLLQTGDRVRVIEGIVSGTLGFLFNQMTKGVLFSQAVKAAKDNGFTEPDPRDDLSGMDVARKMICLAREIGLKASLEDVKLESLIPDELVDCSINEFLERLHEYDDLVQDRLKAICGADDNKVVRYVGKIKSSGEIEVGMQAYGAQHPFANLQETDTIVAIETDRYTPQPMIIQGAGAGAEVTAAGVFADILRLSSSLSEHV